MGRTTIVSINLVEGGVVAVSLSDEQFPHLLVDFRFEDADDALPLDSVCVQRDKSDSMLNPAISTQELRARFPWTAWERAARAAAANYLMGRYADRRPGLSSNGFFEPRDSFDDLLLQVVEEYRANVVAGAHNPAALIAEKHGVRPATARSWLHQARRLGLLGPAADRAAGEVGAPSVLTRKSRAARRRAPEESDNMTRDEDEEEWIVIPEEIPGEVPHTTPAPVEEHAKAPQKVGDAIPEPGGGGHGSREASERGRMDE
jgi:transposase-like protein